MEETLRRLLDEKFSNFQKRGRKSKEEGWLKAIDQLCRAQHSLADDVRKMSVQLSRLESFHQHAVPMDDSVTSSSNVGVAHNTPELEQSVGNARFAWENVDYRGWMESTTFMGNTVLDVGRSADPYPRQWRQENDG